MDRKTYNRAFRSSFPEVEQSSFRTNSWRYGRPEVATELKPLHPTLLHALYSAAELEETLGITLLPERNEGIKKLSYRELYGEAIACANTLKKYGVKRGDRVLMILSLIHI